MPSGHTILDIGMKTERIKPVDPREFAFALQVGSAAFSGRLPMESPIHREFLVEDEEGELKRIVLEDTRLNRAALAIQEQFAPDFEKFQLVMMRYFALLRLTRLEEMTKWQQRAGDDSSVAVHPAVLIVAATIPLAKDGAFDAAEFFSKVEEVAAQEEYACFS